MIGRTALIQPRRSPGASIFEKLLMRMTTVCASSSLKSDGGGGGPVSASSR